MLAAEVHSDSSDEVSSLEAEILAEIDRVLHAVFDLGPNADPSEIRKFYVMLKPGSPSEFRCVPVMEISCTN